MSPLPSLSRPIALPLWLVGLMGALIVGYAAFCSGPAPDSEQARIKAQRDSVLAAESARAKTDSLWLRRFDQAFGALLAHRDTTQVIVREVDRNVAGAAEIRAGLALLTTARDSIHSLLRLDSVNQRAIASAQIGIKRLTFERDSGFALLVAARDTMGTLRTRLTTALTALDDTKKLTECSGRLGARVPIIGGCIQPAAGVGVTTPLTRPGEDVEGRWFLGGVYTP